MYQRSIIVAEVFGELYTDELSGYSFNASLCPKCKCLNTFFFVESQLLLHQELVIRCKYDDSAFNWREEKEQKMILALGLWLDSLSSLQRTCVPDVTLILNEIFLFAVFHFPSLILLIYCTE